MSSAGSGTSKARRNPPGFAVCTPQWILQVFHRWSLRIPVRASLIHYRPIVPPFSLCFGLWGFFYACFSPHFPYSLYTFFSTAIYDYHRKNISKIHDVVPYSWSFVCDSRVWIYLDGRYTSTMKCSLRLVDARTLSRWLPPASLRCTTFRESYLELPENPSDHSRTLSSESTSCSCGTHGYLSLDVRDATSWLGARECEIRWSERIWSSYSRHCRAESRYCEDATRATWSVWWYLTSLDSRTWIYGVLASLPEEGYDTRSDVSSVCSEENIISQFSNPPLFGGFILTFLKLGAYNWRIPNRPLFFIFFSYQWEKKEYKEGK